MFSNQLIVPLKHKKTILVAPLHWGLGHATRCIPIINALLQNGYDVLLGSDGAALLLLQKEFPTLSSIVLPSYGISYPKKSQRFRRNLLLKLPHIAKTVRAEKRMVSKLVQQGTIHGIISDNRLGVRNKKIPSVYITHQLQVRTGSTTWASSALHQRIISKFDACWVPDVAGPFNLSGKLGHVPLVKFPVTYIGPLSRMQPDALPKEYDILCLLSGPEPQRGMLEEQLMAIFKTSEKKIALVQGTVSDTKTKKKVENMTIFNFLETKSLEDLINKSGMVVARSGYTTLMDLAVMEKPVFFIPTPGQFEQEYLAKRLKQQGWVPSCKQHKFKEKKLRKVAVYKGLSGFRPVDDLSVFFGLFEGE